MDRPHQKKSGRFCTARSRKKYQDLAEVTRKRWPTYSTDTVNHDHEYFKVHNSNTCQEGLDVPEEEIGSTNLPKNVIPLDKYRLVVELGHIINQLTAGCLKCRLPLNICSAQGV